MTTNRSTYSCSRCSRIFRNIENDKNPISRMPDITASAPNSDSKQTMHRKPPKRLDRIRLSSLPTFLCCVTGRLLDGEGPVDRTTTTGQHRGLQGPLHTLELAVCIEFEKSRSHDIESGCMCPLCI